MTPVSNNSVSTLQANQVNTAPAQAKKEDGNVSPPPLKLEQNKVTLSEEGKALLAALQEIDKDSEADKKPTSVESFTHGALGLEHPEKIEEKKDGSYSAGQYLKGALSVGAILLALA